MNGLQIISLVGAACASVGLVSTVYLVVQESASPLANAVRGYVGAMAADLRFVRAGLTLGQLLALQGAGNAALLAWATLDDKWALCSLLPLLVALPRVALSRARAKRITAVDAQIDTWLVVLANALRATPSLGEAIASTARLVPAPLSDELELALNEYHLGAPLDVALKTMGDRLMSRTVNVALGTLRIARNTGGDLSRTLEISAAALREIARLEGVVRTKTAEGKAQAVVIALIPFPLMALLNHLNPALLAPLTASLKGYVVMVIAFFMWLTAILWARKILAVDI